LCKGVRRPPIRTDTPPASGNPPLDKTFDDTEEQPRMTVPEENRRKTDTTDEVLENSPGEGEAPAPGGSGRTLREAFEEARVEPDDFARE
jgi:hypothetical protein